MDNYDSRIKALIVLNDESFNKTLDDVSVPFDFLAQGPQSLISALSPYGVVKYVINKSKRESRYRATVSKIIVTSIC